MAQDEWRDGATIDDQMVAAWYRLKPVRRTTRIKFGAPLFGGTLAIALSWLRLRYPSVYQTIVNADTEAADIAVRNGWTDEPGEAATVADWQSITPEQVRVKVRALEGHPQRAGWGRALASVLAKHAPRHLGLLDPQWVKAHYELPEIAAQPKTELRLAALEIRSEVRRGPPMEGGA